jgi:NTP pyrophosphatase (non-canonical NTP hydrolase)
LKPFSNELKPAEAERLYLLIEEMGEATQAACKVLRHGYRSGHPDGGPDNRQELEYELGHVRYAMILLCEAGDLEKTAVHESANEKAGTIKQWLHHQPKALLRELEP